MKPSVLLSFMGMAYFLSSKDNNPWMPKPEKVVLTVESLNRRYAEYNQLIAKSARIPPTQALNLLVEKKLEVFLEL